MSETKKKATAAVAAIANLLTEPNIPQHKREKLESALSVANSLRDDW